MRVLRYQIFDTDRTQNIKTKNFFIPFIKPTSFNIPNKAKWFLEALGDSVIPPQAVVKDSPLTFSCDKINVTRAKTIRPDPETSQILKGCLYKLFKALR